MSFHCPVRDQRLVLDHVVRIGELSNDVDMVDAVLEGAAAFAEGHFAPLDRIGDTVGAKWADGVVTMPPGFREAYAAFVEGGWATHRGAGGRGRAGASAQPVGGGDGGFERRQYRLCLAARCSASARSRRWRRMAATN